MLNGPEATAVQNLSRIYTNSTGIKINVSVFSYDEIYEILSTTGGKAFDILRIDITFLSWFAQKLLVPLEELDPNIAQILPQFLDGVSQRYPWLDLAGKSFSIANGRRQPPEDTSPFNERQFLNIIGLAVKNAYYSIQSPADALDWAQKEFDNSFPQNRA